MTVDGANDYDKLQELVDASLRFTNVLKKKGVSQATLTVAVRSRPLSRRDKQRNAINLTRVLDDRVVCVLDPKEQEGGHRKPDPNDYIRQGNNRHAPGQGVKDREKQYVFDRAFDHTATNQMVYKAVVQGMIRGVLRGLNATVFAYGATGSGKTHTMVGTEDDPGLMVLSMRDVFKHIQRETDKNWIVTCGYLEVYNEELFDLLTPSSKPLDLREDPELGPTIAGLRRIEVKTPEKIFSLLKEGNRRRKTEATDANATSSRSHAVLEIVITRSDRNHYEKQVCVGKLALVDLAGSERASETNNRGQQLKDGANINRSLLALANCINALGKRRKKDFVFVPFRNSKLTRLLKDGLCGNSRTAMIATVASSSTQYHHTINTLKYADRAKEIKTHVKQNQGTVQEHIAEYQRMIDALQDENAGLRAQLQEVGASPVPLSPGPGPSPLGRPALPSENDPAWVEGISAGLNSAAVSRLKQHRAMGAAEEAGCKCSVVLVALEAELAARAEGSEGGSSGGSAAAAALTATADLERMRAAAETAVGESQGVKARLAADVAATEADRAGLMDEVAAAAAGEGRERLKLEAAAARRELERVASEESLSTCDRVICEQGAVIDNLWRVLGWAGLSRAEVMGLGAQNAGELEHGVLMEGAASPGTVRLEQLLTGSCARQFYALWCERRAASRQSLSTPDSGARRRLTHNRGSRRSSSTYRHPPSSSSVRRPSSSGDGAALLPLPSTADPQPTTPNKQPRSTTDARDASLSSLATVNNALRVSSLRSGRESTEEEEEEDLGKGRTASVPGSLPGPMLRTESSDGGEWVEVTTGEGAGEGDGDGEGVSPIGNWRGRVRGQGTVLARRSNQRPPSSNVRIRMSANRPPSSQGWNGGWNRAQRSNPRAYITGQVNHIVPSAAQAAARPSAIPVPPPTTTTSASPHQRKSAHPSPIVYPKKQSFLRLPGGGGGSARNSSEAALCSPRHPLEAPAWSRAPAADEGVEGLAVSGSHLVPIGAAVQQQARAVPAGGRKESARTGLSKLLKGRKRSEPLSELAIAGGAE